MSRSGSGKFGQLSVDVVTNAGHKHRIQRFSSKWAVMYLCVTGIEFASLDECSIGLWKCSDSVVLSVGFFLLFFVLFLFYFIFLLFRHSALHCCDAIPVSIHILLVFNRCVRNIFLWINFREYQNKNTTQFCWTPLNANKHK